MIDIAELQQYLPKPGKWISEKPYSFLILMDQNNEEEIFVINLKIKQDDTKEWHLVKFKLGLGKDKKSNSQTHEGDKPHFEIDIYKREDQAFSANLYFTFDEKSDKIILDYAKGTIVVITKIIEKFIKDHSLNPKIIEDLVYSHEIIKELNKYEDVLIDALYECYKNSNLVVRQNGNKIVINTQHNLKKYMDKNDLEPLYLPLLNKIEKG